MSEAMKTEARVTEIEGKTISIAKISTDADADTRGIGCSSRQRLLLTFTDETEVEFYVGGDFGLAVTRDVEVTLHMRPAAVQ